MDFENKRKAMLKDLSKIQREKVIQKKIDAFKTKSMIAESAKAEGSAQNKTKKNIIVFGNESFFLKDFLHSIKSVHTVTHFCDVDKACDFCVANSIQYIILDMDEPTDWKSSTNLLITVKMLNSSVKFILLTSNSETTQIKTLEAKGGKTVTKPVSIDILSRYLV